MNVVIENQVNELLGKDLPFALYFLPGASEPTFVAGKLDAFNTSMADVSAHKGFVFAPYRETAKSPSFLIKDDFFAHGNEGVLRLVQNLNRSALEIKSPPFSISPEIAQDGFESLVDKALGEIMSNENLEKVVLSRAQNIALPHEFDAAAFLIKINEALPLAFCYLCYIPQQGIWMGATPERLLEVSERRAQTNALAGTLRNNTKEQWSQKELDEQQIVSDYIACLLTDVGVENYTLEGPAEMASGSVRHLCSVFSFDLESENQIFRVINALHPTPAICGMPKVEADKFIQEHENYDREYYAGYLGPLGLEGASHIFVNLRCMKIVGNNASLFVGAGITAGSQPRKEWEETGIKALTLLNVIRN